MTLPQRGRLFHLSEYRIAETLVAAAAVPRPNPKDCDVGSRPGADRQAPGLAAFTSPKVGCCGGVDAAATGPPPFIDSCVFLS